MSKTQTYRPLILDLLLFAFLGVIIWSINIFGQSRFPGNNFFPFIIRSIILIFLVVTAFYLNNWFTEKNKLNREILKFKPQLIKHCLVGIILGCLLIATIWIIFYCIYPFKIIKNYTSTINLVIDIISYSLGNTLEELLFRVFLLLAFIKLLGKIGAILLVSFLFGIFHLPGMGLTNEGLNMILTTFTMSLLFIAVIYYTKSIWTAVTLHITGNLLLHTLGFDGANNGLFKIQSSTININGHFLTLIYEIVVIVFATTLFIKGQKQKNCCP